MPNVINKRFTGTGLENKKFDNQVVFAKCCNYLWTMISYI